MPRQRLYMFDILKGIAIFIVVTGHVPVICVRGLDAAPMVKFLDYLHMPLFFFISGWLAYRSSGDAGFATPRLGARARRLLLPMVCASTVWIYLFPVSGLESPFVSTWAGLWSNNYKNGYWFTLVLFEIFALYALVCPLLRRTPQWWQQAAVWAALWLAVRAAADLMPADVCGFLSADLLRNYLLPFGAGVLASRYRDRFFAMSSSGLWCAAAAVTIALLMRLVCWPWLFPSVPDIAVGVADALIRLSVALLAVALVRPWAKRAFADPSAPAPWARMWQYLGNRSLAIYLLHYWFLFPLGIARPLLAGTGLSLTPMILFSAAVAAGIIALTLLLDRILTCCGPLAEMFAGDSPAITANK